MLVRGCTYVTAFLALAIAQVGFSLASAQTVQPATPPYETLFYTYDGLTLEAYLYKPEGGPFPLVVYNHGSAAPEEEQREWPAPFIARLFVPRGYAVLVPERRGYGKSEGEPFSKAIGSDRGPRFVARQRAEAGDVDAAVDYVLKHRGSSLDAKRIVIMGPSFGGIVTTLAAGGNHRYAAAVIQAPGALNWDRSEEMRKALLEAAGKITIPVACSVAENDATTESARAICEAARKNGARSTLKIYPPFQPKQPQRPGVAPGHAIFGPAGVPLWQDDVFAFLADALRRD